MYNSEILRNFCDHFSDDLQAGKIRCKTWATLSLKELSEKSTVGRLNILSFICHFRGYHQHPNFDNLFLDMLHMLHQRFYQPEDTFFIYQFMTEMSGSHSMPFIQLLKTKKYHLATEMLHYLESYFIRMPKLRVDFINKLFKIEPDKKIYILNGLYQLTEADLDQFLPVFQTLSKVLFQDSEVADVLVQKNYPSHLNLVKDIIAYQLLTHPIPGYVHALGHLILIKDMDSFLNNILLIKPIIDRNPEWRADLKRRILPPHVDQFWLISYLSSLSEEQYRVFRFGLIKLISLVFEKSCLDNQSILQFFNQKAPFELLFKHPLVDHKLRHRLIEIYKYGLHSGFIENSYPLSSTMREGQWSVILIDGWKKNRHQLLEHYRRFMNIVLENELIPKYKLNKLIFSDNYSVAHLLFEAAEINYPYALTHFFNFLLDLHLVYQVRQNIRESLLLSHAIHRAYHSGDREIIKAWSGFYQQFFTEIEFQQILHHVSLCMHQQVSLVLGSFSPVSVPSSPGRKSVSPSRDDDSQAFFSIKPLEDEDLELSSPVFMLN